LGAVARFFQKGSSGGLSSPVSPSPGGIGGCPQSFGQSAIVSPEPQTPSPQLGWLPAGCCTQPLIETSKTSAQITEIFVNIF